ncbi:Re/Si-specific NAD(P)(+) transhydrogenase subunit alpha [Roseitranquillus sediminis]|uniref:Re/Si-specific NAD(P)(+) transhydrogenase subunit alpha n=1 Tax=Roseitranquillus sediminis TaxID=2809051 RepID=UPI001D0C3210|nr:Re/Si-specific NAD(P)(+) transhydrogenase subunit alpha [Roseitranquillus sediminis]MBM9595354.1 Re/Si-specific NAD(P)(+) transhydrogenase subunit alpha [Roseitranquillus sediminis]
MKIGAPKETYEGEARVALTPDSATQISKLGHTCLVESGAGERAGFTDDAYRQAGVEVVDGTEELWSRADVIVKVRPPTEDEAGRLGPDKTLISFFYPGQNEEMLNRVRDTGASVVAMDMVPRISRAQKMDALSSMANIAGYRAVIEAGNNFGRFFTGQVTAAGKVPPAKVLVIGAGVAGLSAIGTSVSLGAVVRAFDVRPEVAEQIESMGAEFLMLEFDEDQSGEGGYAKPASPEFIEKEMALFRQQAPEVDIVITTALIPGRPAPKLWPEEMVRLMKRGSVVVDLAAEQGGNCDLTVPGEKIVTDNGVTVVGYTDFPSRMATQSSTLYATNIRHMLTDLTPGKDGQIAHNMDDDVIRGATVAHGGEITFPPPKPKVQAIARAAPRAKPKELTPQERRAAELDTFRKATRFQVGILVAGALLMLIVGAFAPASFMSHFIVFVLACFVGFQVIWNVSHALHTPLMAVTNAISGIIIIGALLQIGSTSFLVILLASVSILIASINIVGGFLVTRRMLAMFEKS